MRGFTLIEAIIAVSILAILSLAGVEIIAQFQKESLLDSAANEFAATLKLAKNKSMAGEIGAGQSPEDFEPDGLPKYGVSVLKDAYSLFSNFWLLGEETLSQTTIETFTLDSKLKLSPEAEVVFERITGLAGGNTFRLERVDNGNVRVIQVSQQGLISIKRE